MVDLGKIHLLMIFLISAPLWLAKYRDNEENLAIDHPSEKPSGFSEITSCYQSVSAFLILHFIIYTWIA